MIDLLIGITVKIVFVVVALALGGLVLTLLAAIAGLMEAGKDGEE